MNKLIIILLLFACFGSNLLLATTIFCYYIDIQMETQIINPDLGNYEFAIWLMYIPNLIALMYIVHDRCFNNEK